MLAFSAPPVSALVALSNARSSTQSAALLPSWLHQHGQPTPRLWCITCASAGSRRKSGKERDLRLKRRNGGTALLEAEKAEAMQPASYDSQQVKHADAAVHAAATALAPTFVHSNTNGASMDFGQQVSQSQAATSTQAAAASVSGAEANSTALATTAASDSTPIKSGTGTSSLLVPPIPQEVIVEFEHKLEADLNTVAITILAVMGVITFWRGVWTLLDAFVGDSVFGSVCCTLLGLSIVLYVRISGVKIASFWPPS